MASPPAWKHFMVRQGSVRREPRAIRAKLSAEALELRAAPADPVRGIEVAAAVAHGDGGPDDGLHVHGAGQGRTAEPADEPVQPLQVRAGAPVRDADVHVAGERNACGDGGAHDLRGKQAVRLLPHQQKTRVRRGFEAEAVGEVEVGVEQDELIARLAEQQGVGDLAPGRDGRGGRLGDL